MLGFLFIPAYRFQIAGYRDVHEYRDVKQKEPVSAINEFLCEKFEPKYKLSENVVSFDP